MYVPNCYSEGRHNVAWSASVVANDNIFGWLYIPINGDGCCLIKLSTQMRELLKLVLFWRQTSGWRLTTDLNMCIMRVFIWPLLWWFINRSFGLQNLVFGFIRLAQMFIQLDIKRLEWAMYISAVFNMARIVWETVFIYPAFITGSDHSAESLFL